LPRAGDKKRQLVQQGGGGKAAERWAFISNCWFAKVGTLAALC
jgi:hypothetical protein